MKCCAITHNQQCLGTTGLNYIIYCQLEKETINITVF